MKKWKLLKSKKILGNKYITVQENSYKRVDGVVIDKFYKVLRDDFVAIIAIDKNNIIIMEQQYRVGADKVLLELPAGFIKKGEKPEKTAIRELQEETGYIGKNPKYLGNYYVSAGFMNMKSHIVKLDVVGRKKIQNLDKNEEIEIVKIPLKKAFKLLCENKILDLNNIVALKLYESSKFSQKMS